MTCIHSSGNTTPTIQQHGIKYMQWNVDHAEYPKMTLNAGNTYMYEIFLT